MDRRWTLNLDEQVAKDMRQWFKESGPLRRRLQKILTDIIEEKRVGQTLESKYDNPNWAYLQADRAGYERALRNIIDLINE